MKTINFKKKKMKLLNKRAAGITWKCKTLSHLQRKIEKQIFEKHCKGRNHCHYTGECRGAVMI